MLTTLRASTSSSSQPSSMDGESRPVRRGDAGGSSPLKKSRSLLLFRKASSLRNSSSSTVTGTTSNSNINSNSPARRPTEAVPPSPASTVASIASCSSLAPPVIDRVTSAATATATAAASSLNPVTAASAAGTAAGTVTSTGTASAAGAVRPPRNSSSRSASSLVRRCSSPWRLTSSSAVTKSNTANKMATTPQGATPGQQHPTQPVPTNVLQWMEQSCPRDVAPKVLAFCGPQMTSKLAATNRYWFDLIVREDGTWRSLCEGMYKWKEGRDPIPSSWKDYYRLHPCVPIDYPTIPRAMAVACAAISQPNIRVQPHHRNNQVRSLTVLLRPGTHILNQSLVIQTTPNTTISVQTMEMPKDRFYSPRLAMQEYQALTAYPTQKTVSSRSSSGSSSTASRLGQSLRQRMSCGSRAKEDTERAFYDSDSSESLVFLNHDSSSANNDVCMTTPTPTNTTTMQQQPKTKPLFPQRATVLFQTSRPNEPLFRVRQGTLKVKNVDLHHSSAGVDIWNGNSVIQIQPPLGHDDQPVMVLPRPLAVLDHVSLSSASGRGIVNIDGGHLNIQSSCVHSCAATGIYIGGPGSQAEVANSDVIRNGIGSRLRRGIGAGHSGIYLEQGLAHITKCNISSNSLTGISAVSPDNAILWLEESDLVGNGTFQLEMPAPESVSRRQSVTRDNNLGTVGRPALRSRLDIPNHTPEALF